MKQPTKWVYAALTRHKTSCLSKLTLVSLLALTFTACGRNAYHMANPDKAKQDETEPQAQNIVAPLQDHELYYEDELFHLVKDNKSDELEELFQEQPDRERKIRRSEGSNWMTARNKDGDTAIELAVKKGDLDIFNVFLEHIKDRSVIQQERPRKQYFESDFYLPITIENFMRHQGFPRNNRFVSLLYLAIQKGQVEIVQAILEKAKKHSDSSMSRYLLNSLLDLAIQKGQAEMVQKILKKAKEYSDSSLSRHLLFSLRYGLFKVGETPLHQAVISNKPKIVQMVAEALKLLLEESSSKIFCLDSHHSLVLEESGVKIFRSDSPPSLFDSNPARKTLFGYHRYLDHEPCRIDCYLDGVDETVIEESMLSVALTNKDCASFKILLELGCRNFQGALLEGIKIICTRISRKDNLNLSDLDEFDSLIFDYFLKDTNTLECTLLPYFKTNFESFKSDPTFMQTRKTILNYRNDHFMKMNGLGFLENKTSQCSKIASYLCTTDIKFNEQAK